MSYQPRTNIAKDENGGLVTSHSILDRWRNHSSQLFNVRVHGVSDFTLTEINTTENLVPEPSTFKFELAIEKLKSLKSLGNDQIPAESIKAGGKTIRSESHKSINLICNKKELPGEWNELIFVHIYKKGHTTDCVIVEAYHVCQLLTKFYRTSCCQG
jgi:hypothetical protein